MDKEDAELFETKNSGDNITHSSGFIREQKEDKLRFDLIPREALKRLAGLYGRGAKIYGDDNWREASGKEETDIYKQAAFRHFIQWIEGDTDEDHASAIFFNVFGWEICKENGKENKQPPLEADNPPIKDDKEYYNGGPIDLDYSKSDQG